ncbi:MAG: DUF721 domain-containing protein [Bacteroidota bacterium]
MSAERARGRRRGSARRGPVPIGTALEGFVNDLGLKGALVQYGVITSWADVVGEQIARVTVAERMERGVLYVSVASAAWRTELSMKRREIIEKVNRRAGAAVVREIRFR